MKYFLPMLSIIIILGIVIYCDLHVASAEEQPAQSSGIWVAINLYDGTSLKFAEYSGKIERNTFDDIVSNELKEGFFKLESILWIDPNIRGIILLEQTELQGIPRGYTSTGYFKVSNIMRIVPLNQQYIKELLLKKKESVTNRP